MVDMLPDNVLLEIFDFYRRDPTSMINIAYEKAWKWGALTQVCRRWRHIVFESPLRLDLQLFCDHTTPTKRLLDIWPPFPIVVTFSWSQTPGDEKGVENVIAAIDRGNRISEIHNLLST